MHQINLVFTMHQACGKCNPDELYEIIRAINPSIIFEELSVSNFRKSYLEGKLNTLETTAIKKYLKYNPIPHIPVDTLERPQNYDELVDHMHYRVFSMLLLEECRSLRALFDEKEVHSRNFGFDFLNSQYNDQVFERAASYRQTILNYLNDELLWKTYHLDKEVIENRENLMLGQIYQYCTEHPFKKGLFFIGSGHRKSILNKIEEYNEREKTKLKWVLHESILK